MVRATRTKSKEGFNKERQVVGPREGGGQKKRQPLHSIEKKKK